MRVWLALLLLAPGAAAMEAEFVRTGPIFLGTGDVSHDALQVTVHCDDLLRPEMLARGVHQVAISYFSDGTAFADGNSTLSFTSEECLQRDVLQRDVPVQMWLSPEVEALDVKWLRAEVTGAGLPETETTQHLVAAYEGNISVHVKAAVKQAEPQKQIQYAVEIVNHGNGRTLVNWELLTANLQGQVILPDQTILERAGQEHDRKVVYVSYSTPFKNGENSVEEPFELAVTPESAFDPTMKGETTTIQLQANTKGMYVPAPTALLPATLLGLAFLRRRL